MLKESQKKFTNTKLQIQTAVCVDCKHEGYLTKVNVFSLQCICLISFCICIWRFGIWWKVDKAAKHHPRLSWLSAFQPPPSVYMSLCGVHWYPSCMYIGGISVHGTVIWYAWCTDVLCVVARSVLKCHLQNDFSGSSVLIDFYWPLCCNVLNAYFHLEL